METVQVTVKEVCDWIRSNPYTEIIENITDTPACDIVQDFLNYVDTLEKE